MTETPAPATSPDDRRRAIGRVLSLGIMGGAAVAVVVALLQWRTRPQTDDATVRANYIGIGPTFASNTKEFAQLPGLELVSEAMRETTLPAFVIGGVSPDNIEKTIAAGGRRAAVSQAIFQSPDPRRTAERLSASLSANLSSRIVDP